MSVSDTSHERYASPNFLAIYLHAEWGDILFPEPAVPRPGDGAEASAEHPVQGNSGYFYRELGQLAAAWTKAEGLSPKLIADVGGSTGRMIHEVGQHFPDATDLVLAEPSSQFCEWAHRLLKGREFDGWVPVPQHSGQPDFKSVPRERLPAPIRQAHIHNVTAEAIPRPRHYFDLITCLNVIDRTPHPAGIVETVANLLKPGGMMILASPLHFEEKFTPKDKWITDLTELLDQNVWDIGSRNVDVAYYFRYYDRHEVLYRSQVIGARKK